MIANRQFGGRACPGEPKNKGGRAIVYRVDDRRGHVFPENGSVFPVDGPITPSLSCVPLFFR